MEPVRREGVGNFPPDLLGMVFYFIDEFFHPQEMTSFPVYPVAFRAAIELLVILPGARRQQFLDIFFRYLRDFAVAGQTESERPD